MEEQRGKRRADIQLTKDHNDVSGADEHAADGGEGIARASSDILAARKRVSVKRSAPAGTAPKAANPFAGISLTAPAAPMTTAGTAGATMAATSTAACGGPVPAPTVVVNPETKPTSTSGGFGGSAKSGAGFSGFGGLASANGRTASGFGGLAFGASEPLAFGGGAHEKRDTTANENDAAAPTESSPSIFGAQPSVKNDAPVTAQQTGEEGEVTLQSYPASLFEFVEDKEGGKREWRTRGSGEFKLNKDKETGERGRLIMRQRGIGKLLLNANIYKNMAVSVMADGSGISFSCVNCVGAEDARGPLADQKGVSMFAVKLGKEAKDQAAGLAASIKEFV